MRIISYRLYTISYQIWYEFFACFFLMSAMYITASAAYAAGRPCPEDDHPPPHPHAVQRTPKCCRPCSCPVTRSFMLCTEMSMTASLCALPVITVSLCCSSTGGSLQTSSQRTASVGSLHTETRPGTLCWASMIYYGCVVYVFITANYMVSIRIFLHPLSTFEKNGNIVSMTNRVFMDLAP